MVSRHGRNSGSVADAKTVHSRTRSSDIAAERSVNHEAANIHGSQVKILERGEFLRLLGGAIVGSGMISLFGPGIRPAHPSTTESTSVADLGIKPGNSGQVNRLLLVRALSNSSSRLFFPRGDYRIDNSGDDVIIRDFSGELTMEAGARFVFQNDKHRGLVFEGGVGASFYGIRSTFERIPTTRPGSEECWLFLSTSDTRVERVDINGSAGAGLLFWRCDSPKVFGAKICNTMADGLHFENCRDGRADSIKTYNTGDDGLAFVNYARGPANTGGHATNVYVERSRSRGIAVVGQSRVTINNFRINQTAAAGVYVAQENSYKTRVPSSVTVRNGTVYRAGRISSSATTRAGIAYENVGRGIKFLDIGVSLPYGRGVTGVARKFKRLLPNGSRSQEPAGTVKLSKVNVYNAKDTGFNLQGGSLYLYSLISTRVGRTGFFISDANLVKYGKLVARDSSMRANDRLARGFSFERNRKVRGSQLWVVDRKARPSCFVVNASGKQSGSLGTIYDRVRRRKVRVDNSSRLRFNRRG